MVYMLGGDAEWKDVKLSKCLNETTWLFIYCLMVGAIILINFLITIDDNNEVTKTFMSKLMFIIHIALIAFTVYVIQSKKIGSTPGMLVLMLSYLWTLFTTIKITDPVYVTTLAASATPAGTTSAATSSGTPGATSGGVSSVTLGDIGSGIGSGIGAGFSALTEGSIWGRSKAQFYYLLAVNILNAFALIAGASAFQCDAGSGSSDSGDSGEA